MKSAYFNAYSNLYSGYTPALSDAASANKTKTVVEVGGDREFKFNNAADVSAGRADYFEEYPFSVDKYTSSTQSGGNGGKFEPVTCASDGAEKTAYIFTCDETRYNISPVTSTQHRYYAYYQMDIKLQKRTFDGKFEPEEIYSNTLYGSETDLKRKSQWGVKLGTKQTIEIDDPTSPTGKKEVNGYLTVDQIKTGISKLSEADPDQFLYVDASELFSVCALGTTTLDDIRTGLGPNVLVYLPEGMSTDYPNFAAKSGTSFQATKNIILTDKYPFFAPYNIQIINDNHAYYKRLITSAQNKKVWNGTVILPFTIDVNNGVHENEYTEEQVTPEAIAANGDPKCRFTLATMNPTKAISHDNGTAPIDYGVGYFSPLANNITRTVANRPYVVQVDKTYEDYDDDNSSFVVVAPNALIEATPKAYNGIFTNETATGDFTNGKTTASYKFTHTGTYTGVEFDKVVDGVHKGAAEADEQVFYFAHDYFLDSRTLNKPLSLKMLPFRSYYVYEANTSGAKLTQFRIVFGENTEMGGTNGITDVQRDADLAIIPGKGAITIMARADKDVTIHNVRGITVNKCNLRAGDSQTINVPAGVYVINGVKMVVK